MPIRHEGLPVTFPGVSRLSSHEDRSQGDSSDELKRSAKEEDAPYREARRHWREIPPDRGPAMEALSLPPIILLSGETTRRQAAVFVCTACWRTSVHASLLPCDEVHYTSDVPPGRGLLCRGVQKIGQSCLRPAPGMQPERCIGHHYSREVTVEHLAGLVEGACGRPSGRGLMLSIGDELEPTLCIPALVIKSYQKGDNFDFASDLMTVEGRLRARDVPDGDSSAFKAGCRVCRRTSVMSVFAALPVEDSKALLSVGSPVAQ